MMSYKNYVRGVLQSNHYRQVDKTEQDVLKVIREYGLTARQDRFVVPNKGGGQREGKTLLNLTGTIPILSNTGAEERVPVVIWLMETYPASAPVVFVEHRHHHGIKVSSYVNQYGEVSIPYLNRWTAAEPGFNFNLCELIKCLTFYKELLVCYAPLVPLKEAISELPTPKPTAPVRLAPLARSKEVISELPSPIPNFPVRIPDVVPVPVPLQQSRTGRTAVAKKVIPIQGQYSLAQFVDDLLNPGHIGWDFKLDEIHRIWYAEFYRREEPVVITIPEKPMTVIASTSRSPSTTGEERLSAGSKPHNAEQSVSQPATSISKDFQQRHQRTVISLSGCSNGTRKEENKDVMSPSKVRIEEPQKMRVIDRRKVPGVHAEIKRLQLSSERKPAASPTSNPARKSTSRHQSETPGQSRRWRRGLRRRSPTSGKVTSMKK